MAKMMSKPKTGNKVKTVDRGMLPNVDVESNPIFNLKYKPTFDEKKKNASDSTSKMKKGGKVAKVAKKIASKVMMKKMSKKK